MSTCSILDIGASALNAFRIGVQVVSNNIANVDTPGYTRRQVVFQERIPPQKYGNLYLGRGVDVGNIISLRDKNLNRNLHYKVSDLSDYEARTELIGQLERLLNPDEDYGLAAMVDKLWDGFEDLAVTPQGSAERSTLVATATTLCSYFHDLDVDLQNMDRYINGQIDAGITEVNQLASDIADLNVRVRRIEASSDSIANSERDQRDALIEDLASYAGINYFEDTDGTVTIMLDSGRVMVQGETAFSLSFDGADISWSGDDSVITSGLTRGKIGGWLEVRDTVLPEMQANLNELTKSLVRQVNKIHSQGVGLEALSLTTGTYSVTDVDAALASQASGLTFYADVADDFTSGDDVYFKIMMYDSSGQATSYRIDLGAETTMTDLLGSLNEISGLTAELNDSGQLQLTAASGQSFAFADVNSDVLMALGINTFFDGFNAANIAVTDAINQDHDLIAAALVDSKTGEISLGDNSNALALADLRDAQVDHTWWVYTSGQSPTSQTMTGSFNDFTAALISRIGVLATESQANQDFNTMLVNQYQDLIQSASGVNLDEELLDMLRYQRAYQAAARVVTAADELLQTLIQM